MAYIIPSGDAVNLDLAGVYTIPDGDAVVLNLGETTPVIPPIELPNTRAGLSIRFAAAGRAGGATAIPWGDIDTPQNRENAQPWGTPDKLEKRRVAAWESTKILAPLDTAAPWGTLKKAEKQSGGGWKYPGPQDEFETIPWGEGARVDIERTQPSNEANPNDYHRLFMWGRADVAQRSLFSVWESGIPFDEFMRITWGPNFYARVCGKKYEPPHGLAVVLDFWEPIGDIGDGLNVDLFLDNAQFDERCSWREPSGRRDSGVRPIIVTVPTAPILAVYWLMNSISITRKSDSAPIEALSIEITGSLESWTWSFSADIAGRAALELIWPRGLALPVEITATVNGFSWDFLVEEYTQSRVFGRETWRVSGRGRSAGLAAPYAATRSFVSDADRQAVQLANDELQYTGWSADWSNAVNWLVPAGSFSYADKAPMAAIKQLAGAIGAVVQSDPAASTLYIVPRYALNPWAWSAATPDLALPSAILGEIGRQWDPVAACNRIFVAGQTAGGVLCQVTRTGTAGDVLLPMISDPLITHQDAGRERGRMELGRGGNWDRVSFTAPLFAAPGVPGLITPGSLIQIPDGSSTAKVHVVGVTIQAAINNGAVSVRQGVDGEQYHEPV